MVVVRNVVTNTLMTKIVFILSFIVTFFNFTSVHHLQNYPHVKLTQSVFYLIFM